MSKYNYPLKIVHDAWIIRQQGIYTMREIAEKLGVNRDLLMDDLQHYLDYQIAKAKRDKNEQNKQPG